MPEYYTDLQAMYEIVNDAAQAYKGVIPSDRWHEPYMPPEELRREMASSGLELPIFIGGKLNRVPEDSPSSMPVDVTDDLRNLGVCVCLRVEDMLAELVGMAREKNRV